MKHFHFDAAPGTKYWTLTIIKRRSGRGDMTFAEFAKDHDEHVHCISCGSCIIDPLLLVRWSVPIWPIWCVGCRDRFKASKPDGVPLPWRWEKP
jgi:hypothetical protein